MWCAPVRLLYVSCLVVRIPVPTKRRASIHVLAAACVFQPHASDLSRGCAVFAYRTWPTSPVLYMATLMHTCAILRRSAVPPTGQAAMLGNAYAALKPGGLLCIRDHGLYDMVRPAPAMQMTSHAHAHMRTWCCSPPHHVANGMPGGGG